MFILLQMMLIYVTAVQTTFAVVDKGWYNEYIINKVCKDLCVWRYEYNKVLLQIAYLFIFHAYNQLFQLSKVCKISGGNLTQMICSFGVFWHF